MDQKVLAALKAHHKVEGSSVGNPTAANLTQLATKCKLTVAAFTRFLQKKFKAENAYALYRASCEKDEIGIQLAFWSGDLRPEHLANLLPGNRGESHPNERLSGRRRTKPVEDSDS